ncbi:MAG TPA: antitoxin VbhA family protein [Paucimonas sp.]|nr:antitoxin VbhA family protein [Paucimonas sp.]
MTADLLSLDAARERRRYIDLANADPAWQEICASWALEGFQADDFSTEIAGRMIAGQLSLDQAFDAIRRRHGVSLPASSANHE